jgi:hypothetical protein
MGMFPREVGYNMAQLSRALQKIFGNTGGTSEFGKIGSEAAGSPSTTKDLDLIQSLSQYLQGLYAITASANEPPRIEDINALYFLITSQLSYIFQNGIAKYLSTEEYYVGSVIVDFNNDLYISIYGTDGDPNQGNTPSSSPTYWRLLVDYAGALNKAVAAEINAMSEKTTLVSDDEFVIEDSAASYGKKKTKYSSLLSGIQSGVSHSSSADYTIQDTDLYSRYNIVHSDTTPLINRNLPTLADNIGKEFVLQNIGYSGLTYINSEEGANIYFGENTLSILKLFMQGDYAILRAESSGWIVTHCHISMLTGWMNRADWTNVNISSAFTYDNKSAAVDLTGQKFTEADTGNTGLIIYDSGGTGASGIVYIANWTGTGYATNNKVCTCGSGGYTFDVDEGTGSSKNVDYNFYHNIGLNLDYFQTNIFINSSASFTDAIRPLLNQTVAGAQYGWNFIQKSTSYIELRTAIQGLCGYVPSGGGAVVGIDTNDWYININLVIIG